MKDCKGIMELLTLYIDDQLSSSQREEVEKHIDDCQSCRQEFEQTLEIVKMCREIEEVEIPPGFSKELHNKLIVEKARQEHTRRNSFLKNKYVKICTTVAAGFLLLMMIKGFFGSIFFELPKDEQREMSLNQNSTQAVEDGNELANSTAEAEKEKDFNDNYDTFASRAAGEVRMFAAAENDLEQSEESQIKSEDSIGTNEIPELQDKEIVIKCTDDNDFKQKVSKIKKLVQQYGDELKQVNNENSFYILKIVISGDSYNIFEKELNQNLEPDEFKITPMSDDEVLGTINELNSELRELNSEITELKESEQVSNPDQLKTALSHKENIKDKIKKVQDNSQYMLVSVELNNQKK